MEYWLLVGALIFIFMLFAKISDLSQAVNKISEDLTRLSNDFARSSSEVALSAPTEPLSVEAPEEAVVLISGAPKGWQPEYYQTTRDYLCARKKHNSVSEHQEATDPVVSLLPELPPETYHLHENSDDLSASPPVPDAINSAQFDEDSVTNNPVPLSWEKQHRPLFSFANQAQFWKRIEDEFASRWMVWIGGAIMALGVIFMLKMGNEHGMFGPKLRIGVSLGLSLLMTAGGEAIRRSRFQLPMVNARYIPSALSGAGILGLFATMLAAKYLYEMFPMPVLMLALSLVSLAAMLLSLKQGAFMAALGLLGAYTVPLFVSTGTNNVTGLLAYVFVVSLAALGLMRFVYRRWLWMGAMTGNYLWLLVSLLLMPVHQHQVARSMFLLLSTYGFLAWPHLGWVLKCKTRYRTMDMTKWSPALQDSLLVGLVASTLLFILVMAEGPTLLMWATLIGVCVSLLFIARRSPALDLFVPLAAILTLSPISHFTVIASEKSITSLLSLTVMLLIFIAFGLTQVIRPVYRKLWWALASVCVPLVIVITSYLMCLEWFERSTIEATLLVVCLSLCLVWSAFSDVHRRCKYQIRAMYQIAGQLAVVFALFICFSEVTLTLLLALQLLLLVVWDKWRDVDLPKWIFKALTVFLLTRLSLNPFIIAYSSPMHISSWTLPWTFYGFGIPIFCLWLGSRLMPVRKGGRVPEWLLGNALYLTALWVNVELRHLLHGSYHLSLDFASLTDCALHALTFGTMALAYGYRERIAGSLSLIYRVAALASFVLMVLLVLASLLPFNPLWNTQSVGSWPLLNMVTVAYGIPIALMAVALYFWPVQWLNADYKRYVMGLMAVLGMVFITLSVRQVWQGEWLDAPVVYNGEQYCYSLTWMVTAIVMMYCAIRWPNYMIRRASLALLALTIVKLFLWDMAGLKGLYRPVSFFGLGLCLVGVGWVYQKFVVIEDKPESDANALNE